MAKRAFSMGLGLVLAFAVLSAHAMPQPSTMTRSDLVGATSPLGALGAGFAAAPAEAQALGLPGVILAQSAFCKANPTNKRCAQISNP